MANKKDVSNAFYEGVCTTLSYFMCTGVGFSINQLDFDLMELQEYAYENGFEEIGDMCAEFTKDY